MNTTTRRMAAAAIRRFRQSVAALDPEELVELPNCLEDELQPVGLGVEIGPRGGVSCIRIQAGHWDGCEWHGLEANSIGEIGDDQLMDSIEVAIANARDQASYREE